MTMEPVAVVMAMMTTMMAAMAAMAAALASESNAGSEHDQSGSDTKSSFTEHSYSPVTSPCAISRAQFKKGSSGTNTSAQDRPFCDGEHIGPGAIWFRRMPQSSISITSGPFPKENRRRCLSDPALPSVGAAVASRRLVHLGRQAGVNEGGGRALMARARACVVPNHQFSSAAAGAPH
jgi:hypothetical protein